MKKILIFMVSLALLCSCGFNTTKANAGATDSTAVDSTIVDSTTVETVADSTVAAEPTTTVAE